MNFSFLPSKIKEKIKSLVSDKIPITLARSNVSIDGRPGESYVIAYEDRIFFFSRKLGDHDYIHIAGDFAKEVAGIEVRKEGNNTFLDTDINGKKYSLKFSSFEEKNITPIFESWTNACNAAFQNQQSGEPETGNSATPENAADPSSKQVSSLLEGLAAMLMYLSYADDDIAKEEDQYIRVVCNNNNDILRSALQYYKTHNFDELLVALGGMNQEQKLCFLANLMEMGMSDGVLHRSEMDLIKKFCKYMSLSDDEYETIKQVLLIKNKLSVLA
jgi:uncharacterized tellurite resistance protein B-like protein